MQNSNKGLVNKHAFLSSHWDWSNSRLSCAITRESRPSHHYFTAADRISILFEQPPLIVITITAQIECFGPFVVRLDQFAIATQSF